VGHLVYRLENCCIVRTTFAQCVAQGTHHGKIAIRIIHGSYVLKTTMTSNPNLNPADIDLL